MLSVTIFHSLFSGSPIMLGANHIPEDEPSAFANQSHHLFMSNESSQTENWNMTDYDATGWNTSNYVEGSHEFVCAFYNPDFIIYSSLGSFYIPCMVMIFLYGRIFKVRVVYMCIIFYSMHSIFALPG